MRASRQDRGREGSRNPRAWIYEQANVWNNRCVSFSGLGSFVLNSQVNFGPFKRTFYALTDWVYKQNNAFSVLKNNCPTVRLNSPIGLVSTHCVPLFLTETFEIRKAVL